VAIDVLLSFNLAVVFNFNVLRFRQVNHLVEEEIKTTAKLTAKRTSIAAVRDQFLSFATFPTHVLSRYRLNTVDDITSLCDPWEKGD
jgi:hypothetical protein